MTLCRFVPPFVLTPFRFLLVLALVGALAACGGRDGGRDDGTSEAESSESSQGERDERVPIEIARLEQGPVEAVLRFTTNLEAEDAVAVNAQAGNLVTALRVEEGDRVRRGQILVRLEDAEQRSAVARARSQLEKAQREYKRQESLYEQKLISEQAFSESTYEVEQLEIALADARLALSYTTVEAPISGTITERMVNLGDDVQIGRQLFQIVDFDSMVARVFVPERDLARLRVGQTARIETTAATRPRPGDEPAPSEISEEPSSLGGGSSYIGEIERIAPTVDARTGTVKVTVDVPPEPGLRPGMYVEVSLVVETLPEALRVPKRALIYEDSRAFLFRVRDDDTVERLPVIIRVEDRDVVVPTAGAPIDGVAPLAAGDRVVIAGQAGLKNGTEVRLAGSDDEIQRVEEAL